MIMYVCIYIAITRIMFFWEIAVILYVVYMDQHVCLFVYPLVYLI